jgi:hypothetical protein
MEKVHGELPCCRSNKSVERFIIKVEITMKSMLKCMAATLLLAPLCSTGFAAEEQKPQPAPTGPAQMDGMMGGMSEEQMDQRIRSMQEHMLKIHDLMHQIRDAKDEKERERLKEEQRKLMKAHHRMMQQHMQQMMQHSGQMQHGMQKQ